MISLENFIKSLPYPAMIKDTTSTCRYMNEAFSQLYFNDTPENCIGLRAKDVKNKSVELTEIWEDIDKRVFTGESINTLEISFLKKNDLLAYQCFKIPIRDTTNEIIGLYSWMTILDENLVANNAITQHGISDDLLGKDMLEDTISYIEPHNDDGLNITESESAVIFFVTRGFTISQIAKILDKSSRTIESQISSIKIKLSCFDRQDLIETCYKLCINNRLPVKFMHKQVVIEY